VCDRSKYLIEVDAHLLNEVARGQASLVLDNLPCLILLQLVHPLQGDGAVIIRQFHKLPGVIPLDEVNLLLHRNLPCLVLLSFGEGRWLPRAHQMQLALQVSRRQSRHEHDLAQEVVIGVVANEQLHVRRIQPIVIVLPRRHKLRRWRRLIVGWCCP
jgi:hypothetical protein